MTTAAECAFCHISRGEAEAMVVYRDRFCTAFLDRRPLFHGHCLVIPNEHHETLPDLPTRLVDPLFSTARLLAAAVPDAMSAAGTFVAMNNHVSQSVAHLHVHIVPRRPGDGLRGFFWPRTTYEDESHARATAEAIQRAITSIERMSND